ncbi:DUF932 domain-containing protein [Blastopirellula marina]|uniref:DUF932 domain-containing protein n=1 Tax=Blastopirellula marina TaxID=124 RepID=A0A2S8GSG1_9BACT|nr:DUF932 domain-containing protein [Blastopirellula marina]PQO47360.1 DUF932 domain-containing protein [Blastopirellula marina]
MELTRASKELFARSPDERYESLGSLWEYCRQKKDKSTDRWHAPHEIRTAANGNLRLDIGEDSFYMNDWSFSQLCRLAGVAKDTVNRLSPSTADQVFKETLPRSGNKPLQLLTDDNGVRSLHGTAYTRLWDADLVMTIREFAVDFQPPQKGFNGATGLYAGEQDMFCFLIDPNGWCEIDGEAFAPGFFIWNSEVGRRSLGIETFWFQSVCANHIVWDATEVISWKRKHTASISEGLTDIRRILTQLIDKRDERKDGFYKAVKKAMESTVADADEAMKLISKGGINRSLAKKALEIAQEKGRFSIWSIVDALTQLSREMENVGDRTDADQKAAGLLALV